MKTPFKQALKIKVLILLFTGFTFCSMQSCAQEKETKTIKKTKPDYSNVDYSARSNIIKNPEKLTGDEKAIFYHPYFLKLTHEEAKNLSPKILKHEFEKLGIKTGERARFVSALTFYDISMINHKTSCEQWESFKDLTPQSKN